MPIQIRTGRGLYNLSAAAPIESDDAGGVVLTLAMERADGIERVVLRCRVEGTLNRSSAGADALIARLQPWLEREFEQTREAALKSIRTERTLFELRFDSRNPGPFV